MYVVEVGFKLSKDIIYYDNMLKKNGLMNDFNCKTHDIYYTKENLDGLTEVEMKNKCIRLRNVNYKDGYKVENNLLKTLDFNYVKDYEIDEFEHKLNENGYHKVFDTKKKDHHYYKEGMNTKVQLQEIKDIGLLVYLDNSNYYNLPGEEQRRKLIDDLNSYGFNFKYTDLGLDKLRTLYYNKEMFSKNQNG